MKKLIHLVIEYINGDFAYKKYLEHHKKAHKDEQPFNKEQFLRHQQKMKWKKINRCC